ncbi:hypothetical protein [Stackebrandtia nassauensis]|uniref:Uncharacterized protein n=1 Tax=Stackebrandtia nassauensis (strain DSM 44728 / CIP 108903 / NRRL B-16338 / NBRC 102104 / LLR-40K-21) TaxID=446470 RepID=D3PWT2_STANL|nr:hypothetical protein [Stackebrandtia nassauensis]ADD43304.1 hypothetical protein Snas_3646 [Stackebrandtia nassauensis DSM 44728]
MSGIDIEHDGATHRLEPGGSLTVGRDESCDICLDPQDMGISRLAGRIADVGGIWAVTNLSRKRPLHIVDATGFAVPLPVALSNGPPSRRVVDTVPMTVLIAGEEWTHALVLRLCHSPGEPAAPSPRDGLETRTQLPNMTDRRREVLVAMAEGYLRPYPFYDPRPRTYQDIADRLGLSKSQVVKRIEQVRLDLVAAGVLGLEKEVDARRALCEWLLATRALSRSDVDWLRHRRDRNT